MIIFISLAERVDDVADTTKKMKEQISFSLPLTAAFVVLGIFLFSNDEHGDDDDINGVAFDILRWNITGFPGV